MLFEYPLFLSIKACRVRGGKTLRVQDKNYILMNVQLHAPVGLLLTPAENLVVIPRTTRAVDENRKMKFLSGQITPQVELPQPIAGFVKTKTNLSLRTL